MNKERLPDLLKHLREPEQNYASATYDSEHDVWVLQYENQIIVSGWTNKTNVAVVQHPCYLWGRFNGTISNGKEVPVIGYSLRPDAYKN